MMVGQGKVSGHSQTDFKHKKGFSKIKELHNKSSRTKRKETSPNNVEINEKRYIREDNRWEIRLKVFAGITIFVFAGVLFFIFQQNMSKEVSVKKRKKKQVIYTVADFNFTKEELARAYNANVSSGKKFLNCKKYKEAEPYFQRALSFEKGGIEANAGLLEVVCYRCYLEDVNCEGARLYLNRAEANNWLSKVDLEYLKELVR